MQNKSSALTVDNTLVALCEVIFF